MSVRLLRSAALILPAIAFGCGGSSSSEEPVFDGAVDDAGAETSAADAPPGPWRDKLGVMGIGSAAGTGVLGPVYPTGVWASADQVVVVGIAKAAFTWGGTTYPSGGFVLAVDASTGALRWHRQVGESVFGITAMGDDLAIVGAFSKSISLPTAGAPIALSSAGRTDGVVAVLTKAGEFRWARRYGSPGFDQGFAVTSDGDAVVVAGAITGTADLGEGCGTLQAQVGGDDGDGHPTGIYDAVVLRYAADGGCPWGAAIGAPIADDMGFGVTAIDGALFVSGAAARPLLLRTTAGGTDVNLGGAATTRPAPFLLRLDPKAKRAPSTWFVTEASPGGRGRAVAHRDSELLWAFTTASTAKLTHDALGSTDLPPGGHVVTLRDDALVRNVDLGPKILDVGPIAIGDGFALVAATEADPGGVVFAKLTSTSTSVARHLAGGATGMPFATAAYGSVGWIAGYSGAPITLGDPPIKIDPGPQGGFFLAGLAP